MKKRHAALLVRRVSCCASIACLLVFLQGTVSADPLQSPSVKQFIKLMQDRIGAIWYPAVNQKIDALRTEQIRVTFSVSHEPRIQYIHIFSHHGNDALVALTIDALKKVKVPPLPKDFPADQPMKFQFYFSIE